MGKHKNIGKYNDFDSMSTDKFEMIEDEDIYTDRASKSFKRGARRERKKAAHNKRDRYLDEKYEY